MVERFDDVTERLVGSLRSSPLLNFSPTLSSSSCTPPHLPPQDVAAALHIVETQAKAGCVDILKVLRRPRRVVAV